MSDTVKSLLERALLEHVFSGYQLFSQWGDETLCLSGGKTSYWPKAKDVTDDTLFDLGSLTKVVVTTSLIALETEGKKLDLESAVSEYLPQLPKDPFSKIKIADLLSHCSGLIDWYPLYQEWKGGSYLDWFIKNQKKLVIATPRTEVKYSDLGFLLLGEVLTRRGEKLRSEFTDKIATPLGLQTIDYGPVVKTESCAATEYSVEKGKLLQGEVFDENCQVFGGVAAHAGLFGTATDLGKFCEAWRLARVGKSKWMNETTAKQFTEKSNRVSGSTWALGWDTKSPWQSSAGERFSKESFGHLGYPGCSFWVDPTKNVSVVFLTNRIHPSRLDDRIKRIRPLIHNEVMQFWKQ